MNNDGQPDTIASNNLIGTTMKVYWVLLKDRKTLSLREVQRKAGLSTASLAMYHLNKLIKMELVKSFQYGGYSVSRDVRVGFLRFFVGRKGLLIPRYAFYFAFFITELMSYLFFIGFDYQPTSIVLILTLIAGSLFTLIETISIWKSSPIVN